jgi:hypothetical protein
MVPCSPLTIVGYIHSWNIAPFSLCNEPESLGGSKSDSGYQLEGRVILDNKLVLAIYYSQCSWYGLLASGNCNKDLGSTYSLSL